jgi:tetratricopeptide (TPR) repeat protein
MIQAIQRALFGAAFVAVGAFAMSPAAAQTRRQLDWCSNESDTFSPRLRIDGCTAAIQSARTTGENISWAFYNRGIAHAKLSQYDRAIADFDQALKLDPDSIFALNNRGAALARKGEYDRAIADFSEAIRLDAQSATSYNNRGTAYARIRQYDRALEDFEQAIRLDPNDTSALSNRRLAQQLKSGPASTPTEIPGANPTTIVSANAPEPIKARPSENAPNYAGTRIKANPVRELDGIRAENNVWPAPASKERGIVRQAHVNPLDADVNDATARNRTSATKPMKAESIRAESKAAAKSKGAVNYRTSGYRNKPHHVTARSHRSKRTSVFARLFRKPQFVTDIKKIFKIASRPTNSSGPNPRPGY